MTEESGGKLRTLLHVNKLRMMLLHNKPLKFNKCYRHQHKHKHKLKHKQKH